MGVSTTPPLPKSQPDIAKINSFSGLMVTVSRQLAPRGNGQMVVTTQRMSKDKLLDLQVSLPLQHGPGYFLFTVADEGGTGEDVWLTRLGPEQPQEGFSMPGSSPFAPPSGMPNGAPSPLAPEVVQIMPGFFHHAGLGLLRTPWGKTIQWREGDPWPEQPAYTSGQQQAATPWQGWSTTAPGQTPWGWGGYPVNDSDDKKRLEAEVAEMRRQADLAEQRRREDEARRDRERERDEARRREEDRERREEQRSTELRELLKAITTKPSGPSDAEIRLERENAETKRRLEEQVREEARRREDQLREEARRVEMKAMEDRHTTLLRELKDRDRDRPDPLMQMMTTIITTQSQAAMETARLNREAADRTAAVTERHSQQLVETMRSDRSGAAESSRVLMEQTREMLGMQREVVQYVVDNAGSNNDPWYARAIAAATEKLGPGLQAMAAARSQQPIQPQYVPPAGRTPPAARPMAPSTTRPIPTVDSPAPAAGIEANSTGDRPEGTVLDKDHFIVPGGPNHPGYRIPVAYVQEHGWTRTLNEIARRNAPSPVVMPEPAASAMNGANGAAPAAPTLTVVPPPANSVPATGKPKKSRGRKTATVPPPAGPVYSGEELEAMSPEQAIALVAPFSDADLFGPLFSYVQQLRSGQPSPEEAVAYIIQGRDAGVSAPAMDLLRAKQLDALVERIFPEAPEEYQEAVVKVLAAKLGLSVIEDGEEAQA